MLAEPNCTATPGPVVPVSVTVPRVVWPSPTVPVSEAAASCTVAVGAVVSSVKATRATAERLPAASMARSSTTCAPWASVPPASCASAAASSRKPPVTAVGVMAV